MGRDLSNEMVRKHSNDALDNLEKMFGVLISSGSIKKADLIAYWLNTYSGYLLKEVDFDPASLPRYERGDIISVNFGFNVGSEQGGLHYAVVINNFSELASPVLTVIPLTSGTKETTYKRDVYLGNELYERLYKRYEEETKRLQESTNSMKAVLELLDELTDKEEAADEVSSSKMTVSEHIAYIKGKNQEAEERLYVLQNVEKRAIEKLKKGSIALIGQITTISKIRIYKPKSKRDLMFNLKFSDGAMDKINNMLKELYIYEK